MARALDTYLEAKQQGLLWHPSAHKEFFIGVFVAGDDYLVADSSGNVETWHDISGNGNDAINASEPGDRPHFNPPKGLLYQSSVGHDDTNNGDYLALPAFGGSDCYGFTCMFEYDFSTFQKFTYILAADNLDSFRRPRCLGESGDDHLRNEAFNAGWKNGAIGSATANLPCLPMLVGDIITVNADGGVQTSSNGNGSWQIVGSGNYNDRSIRGRVSGYALFAQALTEYQKQVIEGFIMWNALHSPGNLDPRHAFANRPPLITDGF